MTTGLALDDLLRLVDQPEDRLVTTLDAVFGPRTLSVFMRACPTEAQPTGSTPRAPAS